MSGYKPSCTLNKVNILKSKLKKNKKTQGNQREKYSKQSPKLRWRKFIIVCSFILNAFLIFLTISSYIPNISVEPKIWVFDGTMNYAPITFTNDNFINVLDVSAIAYIDSFHIGCTSSLPIIMGNQTIEIFSSYHKLEKNKPKTSFLNCIRAKLRSSIKEVEMSKLIIEINYKLPFINSLPLVPEYFHESYRFKARKYSDYSIEWYSY